MPTLSGLFIYPVKSLRGCRLDTTSVDALGLAGDRRFLVVDETGRFLTQRTLPRMALISTALSVDTLTLSAAGTGEVHVPRATDPAAPLRTVSVWGSQGLVAEDCGELPADWLGNFLGVKCRLVRAGSAFHRPVLKPGRAQPGDVVSFADGFPLLAVSEASLADLNGRLVAQGENPVPMDRFRTNVVLTGCPAYAEETWPRFRIGSAVFRAGGPCGRCPVITTDQLTGERGREPLRTLATYRRDAANPTSVNFGQNLLLETNAGELRVGDAVELLRA